MCVHVFLHISFCGQVWGKQVPFLIELLPFFLLRPLSNEGLYRNLLNHLVFCWTNCNWIENFFRFYWFHNFNEISLITLKSVLNTNFSLSEIYSVLLMWQLQLTLLIIHLYRAWSTQTRLLLQTVLISLLEAYSASLMCFKLTEIYAVTTLWNCKRLYPCLEVY